MLAESLKLYKRFEEGSLYLQSGYTLESVGGGVLGTPWLVHTPDPLGVGQAWVLLALPSRESNVQLNLRIADSKLPNRNSGCLLGKELKGHYPPSWRDGD